MATHQDADSYRSNIESSVHGDDFQKDIALSLFLWMRKQSSDTRLAYEMTDADKFDDVVLIDDGKRKIHFIQAKHAKADDDKVKYIELGALFPRMRSKTGKSPFDLLKYFKSYLKVTDLFQQEATKTGEKEYTHHFYLFTNKDLSEKDNEWMKTEIRQENEILRFTGYKARYLKLNPTEKGIDFFNKDIITIKEAIKELFSSGKVSEILKDYCIPLREVLTIDINKNCSFSENFKSENINCPVAKLCNMLQIDLFDMNSKMTVEENFLEKDSMNKLLPTFIKREKIYAFFRDFTLSVAQPNDLRPIIYGELRDWTRQWIRPDIFGQLSKKTFDQVYTNLYALFKERNERINNKDNETNKPNNIKEKYFLKNHDAEECLEEIKCEMKNDTIFRTNEEVEELEKIYINRRIRYEEVAQVAIEEMDEKVDKQRKSGASLPSKVQKPSHNDEQTDANRESTRALQISDIDFVKELRESFKNQQLVLLVADPGMGKTSLLQFISFEIQKQSDVLVFLVYFSGLVNALNKKTIISNLGDVLEILNAALSDENCAIIGNAPKKRDDEGYSIVLVLDAFDEIHCKYTDKVIKMLNILHSEKDLQIIISSRKHVQTKLEKTFGKRSMFLEPFSKQEQISYLKKMWKDQNNSDTESTVNYEALINHFHSSIPSNLYEICGLPLMMKMLAEIYSDKFKQSISGDNAGNMHQFDFSDAEFNLVQLYEQFARKCFHKKFLEKYNPIGVFNNADVNSLKDRFMLEHQLLAIELLNIEMINLFANPLYKKRYEQFQNRCLKDSEKSLMVRVVNGNVQFCHLSYSEYFVSKYLCDNIFILGAEVVIGIMSHHDVIRKLSMIKLEKNEAYFEIMNKLSKIQWKIALWACESDCRSMVSSLKENFEIFPIENFDEMLELSAKNGYYEICKFLIDCDRNPNICIALNSAAENGYDKLVELFLPFITNENRQAVNGESPLNIASRNGHTNIVALLIKHNYDPKEVVQDQWTALHSAAQNGHDSVVGLLIQYEADVNAHDKDKWTPLHLAAQNGHIEVVKLLLQKPVNVNAEQKNKYTALHLATLNGYDEVVKLLFSRGANINSRIINGKTLLHIAARKGHANIAAFLMQKKSNPNDVDGEQRTALHSAAQNGHLSVVDLLLQNKANVDACDKDQWTPLHLAAQNGHFTIVERLLNSHATVSAQEKANWTALHLAAKHGHFEVVKFLTSRGANNSSQLINRKTPLHMAAQNGHVNIATHLLEQNSDPNEVDKDLCTALHLASQNGHINLVKLLLQKHANVNSEKKHHYTPLHLAVLHGRYEVVKILISNGAVVNCRIINGKTPLHIAARRGYADIVTILIDNQSDPNEEDNDKWTALHSAAANGHIDVMELLLQQQVDVNAEEKNQFTPLHLAAQNGHDKAVKVLIDRGANTNSRTIDGETPLHIARQNGRKNIALFLTDSNSDPNEVD